MLLSENQVSILNQYGQNTLQQCIKELEDLDWSISMMGKVISQEEIDRSFEYYCKLGEERKKERR